MIWRTGNFTKVAARGNHLEIIIWLRQNGVIWDERTIEESAVGGHFETFKFLVENKAPANETKINWYCARGGNLEMLKWSLEIFTYGVNFTKITSNAAKSGDIQMVTWLLEKNFSRQTDFEKSVLGGAAKGGHLELFIWLLQKK